MTLRDDNGTFVLECDDCKAETQNTTLNDLLVNSALARWKVHNDPDFGVQHFCSQCGQKVEHELAILLRTELKRNGIDVPLDLGGDTGNTFSLSLDDVVVEQANARAGRVVPDMGVVNKAVATKGEFKFSVDLEEDE